MALRSLAAPACNFMQGFLYLMVPHHMVNGGAVISKTRFGLYH
jgi:hypothetical protein